MLTNREVAFIVRQAMTYWVAGDNLEQVYQYLRSQDPQSRNPGLDQAWQKALKDAK